MIFPKLVMFALTFIIFIVFFSLLFIFFSMTNFQLRIEITYKPLYQPNANHQLFYSIFLSDLNQKMVEWLKTSAHEKEIEEQIKLYSSNFKIEVEGKILGNENLKGNETSYPFLLPSLKIKEVKVYS